MSFSCPLCLVQLSGSAVTEGEVRKCSCWVCTSQSRVGGENSSLLAGRRAGRDRQGSSLGEAGGRGRHAGSWCRRHGYLDTFLTCRWEVLGICIGSAGLPRLASCKCLLSPSDYCQAELGGMFRAVRCDAARLYQCGSTELCQLCPRVLFTFEVSRSCPEVPRMFSPSILRHLLSIPGSRIWGWTEMSCLITTTRKVCNYIGFCLAVIAW